MHRQTTKHIRHTKGTHFSGGLVIILLAGVGSHENSTLLFPVGCEFTRKVHANHAFSVAQCAKCSGHMTNRMYSLRVRHRRIYTCFGGISVTRLAPTMKLNTVKKIAVSLLVAIIPLLVLKRYSNVLELFTFHIISETTFRDLYMKTALSAQPDFDTIHLNSTTQQLYSSKNHSNYTISTSISASTAFHNPLELNISEGFRFPHPKAVNLIDILRRSSWIQELNSLLEAWEGQRQLIMVTSNSAYKEVLLNWLLSATLVTGVALKRILVVAHDESMWHLMRDKGIFSIFVPPSSLFPSFVDISMFGKIMMTRISVMCLLNHWRFDVAMIDTDALLLKDPWSLFEQFPESDIVASMGNFPGELSSQWGTSLCVGVILIRSSNQTGIVFFSCVLF